MMGVMRAHHRVQRVIIATLASLSAWSPPAMAEERRQCPICMYAGRSESTYPQNAGHTLARGAANALLGWTDVIRQPAREVKRSGNLAAGVLDGVSSGVVRTFSGLGEVLTFWIPKVGEHYVRFSRDCPVCEGQLQSAPSRPSPTAR